MIDFSQWRHLSIKTKEQLQGLSRAIGLLFSSVSLSVRVLITLLGQGSQSSTPDQQL